MRLEPRRTSPLKLTRLEAWTPRECPGYEPESSLGDKAVLAACVILCLLAVLYNVYSLLG